MGWISDSVLWNIALPVKGYVLDGMQSGGTHPRNLTTNLQVVAETMRINSPLKTLRSLYARQRTARPSHRTTRDCLALRISQIPP